MKTIYKIVAALSVLAFGIYALVRLHREGYEPKILALEKMADLDGEAQGRKLIGVIVDPRAGPQQFQEERNFKALYNTAPFVVDVNPNLRNCPLSTAV